MWLKSRPMAEPSDAISCESLATARIAVATAATAGSSDRRVSLLSPAPPPRRAPCRHRPCRPGRPCRGCAGRPRPAVFSIVCDDGVGRRLLAQVLQHHRARPDLADRVGRSTCRRCRAREPCTGSNIEGRAFSGLMLALGRDADGARHRRAEVGQDVAEQVRAHHHVEPVRMLHEMRAEDVDVELVGRHLRDSASPSRRSARPNRAW